MSWETLKGHLPKSYSPQDQALVRRAYEYADEAHTGQHRKSGEPYIIHPEAVAAILADLRLDARTVSAALLHDVAEDTAYKVPILIEEFGAEVGSMVAGVTKLESISEVATLPADSRDPKVESFRKMLLAMVNDVRVVLIKLADRLHNMRTMGAMPADKQQRISRETLDIYAPLASVLGIYAIKWELEDLSFRYLEPDTYVKMKAELAERREQREAYVDFVIQTLRAELVRHGIEAQITGRPKHIYSIWRKMKRKGVMFDQIYDQHGLRLVVPKMADCYAALGVVHSLWRPIQGEFDDYIANPKDNQYQSLHTAVVGPNGRPLEVQIRTPEMDRIADVGIAAHWRYKLQKDRDEAYERKIQWLRSVLDWGSQEHAGGSEFIDTARDELFKDRVYVFTPKGEVIDLPAGSTPIDFAYRVHTDIGHRCRGAKVRGKLVTLDTPLESGDQVEILTAKRGGPSRDWLNPHQSYVKTSRARTKIRQWFKQQNRDENISAGREQLERELRRLGVENMTYGEVAALFGHAEQDDFLAELGTGDVTSADIAKRVLNLNKPEEVLKEAHQEGLPQADQPQKRIEPKVDGIVVLGTGNLMSVISRCCNPMAPDEIIGFVTRGRGVSVHRKDCPNVLRLDRERLIRVDWGETPQQLSRVKIRVMAYDRAGLLRDIVEVLDMENINMEDASAVTARRDNLAMITATLEVRDAEQLDRVLYKINQVQNVREVRRQRG